MRLAHWGFLAAFVPVAASINVAGCASSPDENVGDGTGAASTGSPITLSNWQNHTKIVALRDQVGAIDRLQLKKEDHDGCDGGVSKFTDPAGKIRKIREAGGEDDFSGTIDAYYSDAGKLLFLFNATKTESTNKRAELRVYFKDDGSVLWQVYKEGRVSEDLSRLPFRAPPPDQAYRPDPKHRDPAAWFRETGCGEGAGRGDDSCAAKACGDLCGLDESLGIAKMCNGQHECVPAADGVDCTSGGGDDRVCATASCGSPCGVEMVCDHAKRCVPHEQVADQADCSE